MDEKTAEQVGVFLKMVNESLQSGKDFVLEQAPLVVQEMVLFGRVWYGLSVAIGVMFILFGLYVANRTASYVRGFDDPADSNPAFVIPGVFGTLTPLTIGCITVCVNLESFVQACFAPRLYVLEQVSHLLK